MRTTGRRSFASRWHFLADHVRGRDVLDVGCAELLGTSTDPGKRSRWLHAKIASCARSLLGVDENREQVERLVAEGYDIVVGDAETLALERTFDVVFAGELIEHLSNPGRFLDNARRHLRPEGRLILTTPNRFDAAAFLGAIWRDVIPGYHKPIAKHVAYFDEEALAALLERHGFETIEVANYWTFAPTYDPPARRWLLAPLVRWRPKFTRGLMLVARWHATE